MPAPKQSGQAPFAFIHRPDLSRLPAAAQEHEANLHGGFAHDARAGFGQIYYGMPGCGIMRIDADLQRQEIIPLPDNLVDVNFHSTKIGDFDGQPRLILAANLDEQVVVMNLDGVVDFVLPRPVFEQYQAAEAPYKPTDTVLVDDRLYIADGYGSNYITTVDVTVDVTVDMTADAKTHAWREIFGGKTEDPQENGRFTTAHGINFNPVHHHLDIADRPNARIQSHGHDGHFIGSHGFPTGSFLCGINYLAHNGRWLGVIGCLRDPQEGRPAPIYIIDATSYKLLSTIRPKEELGIDLAQHLHNVVLHQQGNDLYLVCQAWNRGHYFVLQRV